MTKGTSETPTGGEERVGLRERKKRETRRLIADTAARLFAERGYERVAVVDVADAAGVSEQTVYNYFPAKQDLVFDRKEAIRQRLTTLIRQRPKGVSPAAAIRDEALRLVEGIRSISPAEAVGGLDLLAWKSPTVRRLSLEVTDALADDLAAAIVDTTKGSDQCLAKVQAIALAWVVQTITDESGRRRAAGESSSQIADELRPAVERIIDSLDGWMGGPGGSAGGRRAGSRESRSKRRAG